jgi:hypothetical protein
MHHCRVFAMATHGFQEHIMSRWQSFRMLAGWALVCVASGSMATVVAQTLTA